MTNDAPSLLILSGVQGYPRRYRTFHLFEQARLVGLDCELSHVTDPDLRTKVKRSDVVILHRTPFDSQVAWIEKVIHRNNGLFIIDFDDILFEPEAVKYIHRLDFGDPVRRSLYHEDTQRYRKTLDVCDAAITSSDFLANAIRMLGKPAYVHRNAFSMEMRSLADRVYSMRVFDPTKIVIGYSSGTPTHDQDFTIVAPALQVCLTRHPDVELWLLGYLDPGGDWGNLNNQIKKFSYVPWRNLPELQVKFDINLAPLVISNPVGQSKSEIKYMEAALLRVPTVASPGASYSTAIRQGENGYLANDLLDWVQYLETLIESPSNRITMGGKACQDVLQHYHPKVRASQLMDTLNLIAGNKFKFDSHEHKTKSSTKIQPSSNWISAEQERHPTHFQSGIYTLRHRSVGTLLKLIWIFIRKLVSPIFPYHYPLERTESDALPW
jgi:glycosyltransferase involved in cell wall biosynthesis